jgi:hypothetical protein
MSLTTQIDHLVVVARTLDEGVQWCEATLGITPGPGGEHKLFGTHNRLFRIATVNFPRAYFEIIAINAAASSEGRAPGKRWFDMDDDVLQAVIAQGPRLVHFVANTSHVQQALAALKQHNIDRGPALPASRMTPNGLLEWQITVRPDGQRLFQGALPTLIEWGPTHPANSMPDSAIQLHSLRITHPDAQQLQAAYQSIGLQGIEITAGTPNLIAQLHTPRGLVTLESKGI